MREEYQLHSAHLHGILASEGQGWEYGRRVGLDHPGIGQQTYTDLTMWHLAHARGAVFHCAHAWQQMR